jgi:hypothetical protein
MLDGVDSVDWAHLTCAGVMPDMPRYLRSLASADQDEAEGALQEIAECILHQGTVYQATAAVIPFLAELAHCAVHNRPAITSLLGEAALEPELRDALEALRLLADMGAVTAIPQLTGLADRDERIVDSGRTDAIVWEDERLQRAIFDAVAALSGRQAGPGPERCAPPSLGIDAE